ncbi:CAP domain-containing protein [Frankia sp. CiP3]|uniref:CAP domain-containing protein n=1 Tax=Frankia sp. CiP3 TaxID=2880971 RepID=UPI001EF55DD8|nr:CAP domain-containing protein [Frankia sp. CiP3]
MDRHRRHRRSRQGWSGAVLAVFVLVLATTGLLLTQVVHGGGPAAAGNSTASSALMSSTSPVELAAQSVSQQIVDRGTVSGTVQIRTAVPADAQTWVAYVLRGPGTIVRVAPVAPYEISLDTRSVPDGLYTLNEAVFNGSRTPWVRTSRMRIINTPAPASTSDAHASPGATVIPSPSFVPSPQPRSAAGAEATVTGPARTAAPAIPVAATEAAPADPVSQVVTLTNTERAKAGCAPLTVDSRLTAAAQAHSDDMATHNYFSHTSQDGRTPFQRMAAAGYQFSIAAENIAAGQRTPAEVMTGWMNSAGHRENILNCSLKQIGVGYGVGGSYGMYWTQDFGTP